MDTTYLDDAGVRLMLEWQGGDETAFDRLVEAYSGQVWALLTRFLPGQAGRWRSNCAVAELARVPTCRLCGHRKCGHFRYEISRGFLSFPRNSCVYRRSL